MYCTSTSYLYYIETLRNTYKHSTVPNVAIDSILDIRHHGHLKLQYKDDYFLTNFCFHEQDCLISFLLRCCSFQYFCIQDESILKMWNILYSDHEKYSVSIQDLSILHFNSDYIHMSRCILILVLPLNCFMINHILLCVGLLSRWCLLYIYHYLFLLTCMNKVELHRKYKTH